MFEKSQDDSSKAERPTLPSKILPAAPARRILPHLLPCSAAGRISHDTSLSDNQPLGYNIRNCRGRGGRRLGAEGFHALGGIKVRIKAPQSSSLLQIW